MSKKRHKTSLLKKSLQHFRHQIEFQEMPISDPGKCPFCIFQIEHFPLKFYETCDHCGRTYFSDFETYIGDWSFCMNWICPKCEPLIEPFDLHSLLDCECELCQSETRYNTLVWVKRVKRE